MEAKNTISKLGAVGLIGLVASILTIVGFTTGKDGPEFFSTPQPVQTPVFYTSTLFPEITQTPTAENKPEPNDIIQQPQDLEVYPQDTAKFTVVASKAVKSYMWQYCKDGATWKNVTVSVFPSAITNTLVFKAHSAHNGFQYRCIVHFEDGTTTVSAPAKITVKSY